MVGHAAAGVSHGDVAGAPCWSELVKEAGSQMYVFRVIDVHFYEASVLSRIGALTTSGVE